MTTSRLRPDAAPGRGALVLRPANLRAIDIWIGEPADLGKGHGTRIMALALARCFADPAVSAVLIDPLATNTRAHRFYERLGFRFVERRRFGADECCVYRLERADYLSRLAQGGTLQRASMALADIARMATADSTLLRLNLGCGPKAAAGWLNCDVLALAGVEARMDLRRGLALASGSMECIAAIHVLQDLAWNEIAPALRELLRVLAPGGTLRLAVPDLDNAIRAYLAGNDGYFYVPAGDARSVGAKLVTQIVWYGSVRTPFTYGFLQEWLENAGYAHIARMPFGISRVAGLAALDNRERETLFVEAAKPPLRAGASALVKQRV